MTKTPIVGGELLGAFPDPFSPTFAARPGEDNHR
jgi:hypothetical protein